MKLVLIFVSLLLFLGCSESDGFSTSKINEATEVKQKAFLLEQPAESWYVRLEAEATERKLITYSAQLGVVDEADASQKYSLSHYPPMVPYIDIRFEDPSNIVAGNYKSYFQEYTPNIEKSWIFTVRSDDPNANVVLSWRGLYVLKAEENELGEREYKEYLSLSNPILKYMQLTDEVTGKRIPIIRNKEIQSISFNMDGSTERRFRWELLNEEVNTTDPITSKRASARIVKQIVIHNEVAEFDMDRPPVIGNQ